MSIFHQRSTAGNDVKGAQTADSIEFLKDRKIPKTSFKSWLWHVHQPGHGLSKPKPCVAALLADMSPERGRPLRWPKTATMAYIAFASMIDPLTTGLMNCSES